MKPLSSAITTWFAVALTIGVLVLLWVKGDSGASPRVVPRSAVEQVPLHGVADGEGPELTEVGRSNARTEVASHFKIVVLDATNGLPVQDCSVYLLFDSSLSLLGETHAEGRLEVPASCFQNQPTGSIVCSAAGYQRKTVNLESPFPTDLTMTLEPGSLVVGRVIHSSTRLACPGVTVFALDSASVDNRVLWEAAGRWRSFFATATTDEEGRFLLRGLEPGTRYDIVVAGNGYCSRGPIPVVADSVTNDIPVFTAYGVIVRLRKEGGGHIQASTSLAQWPLGEVTLNERGCMPLSQWSWPAQLLGCGLDSFGWQGGYTRAYLWTSQKDVEEIGPATMTFRIPGYREGQVSCMAERLRGDIPAVDVELPPLVTDWGQLLVTFTGIPTPIPDLSSWKLGFGRVVLQKEGEAGRYDLGIYTVGEQTDVVSGIPCGTYTARFLRSNGFSYPPFGFPGMRIEVAPSDRAPCVLRIQLSELGGIQCRILNADGTDHRGGALIEVESGDHSRFDSFAFARPPFNLYGLPSGDYHLRVMNPSCQSSASPIIVPVEPLVMTDLVLVVAM